MTSPPDRRLRAAEIHANLIRTFKTQLILTMAIAASKAAASPSHRNNSMQAARQLFET
jgi:hypothetical protein